MATIVYHSINKYFITSDIVCDTAFNLDCFFLITLDFMLDTPRSTRLRSFKIILCLLIFTFLRMIHSTS
jgi:hypothetical protein